MGFNYRTESRFVQQSFAYISTVGSKYGLAVSILAALVVPTKPLGWAQRCGAATCPEKFSVEFLPRLKKINLITCLQCLNITKHCQYSSCCWGAAVLLSGHWAEESCSRYALGCSSNALKSAQSYSMHEESTSSFKVCNASRKEHFFPSLQSYEKDKASKEE